MKKDKGHEVKYMVCDDRVYKDCPYPDEIQLTPEQMEITNRVCKELGLRPCYPSPWKRMR